MNDKVIIIAGPTGVGKTSCSIEVAKAFHGEIISGDSMQVYKELSIGTAKIKSEEMHGIQHHLVDCISMKEEYNVKVFQEKGRTFMEQMKQANHLPIVCGGTGLYIKSLLYDYEFLEQEKDIEFDCFLETLTNDQLFALLTHVDKGALKTIHKHNRQRLVRALQMAHLGIKKSDILEKQEHKMLYDAYCIGLTCERSVLYERINQRVDKMMEEGLLQEITTLYQMYNDSLWELQSMQSIGYKEWKPYFQENEKQEVCVEAIKKNSRNFAKRQYTWFNNQMPMHWYDVTNPDYLTTIVKDIEKWLL